MIVILVTLVICIILFICVTAYTIITNSDGRTHKVIEAPKKMEPTVKISINFHDKRAPLEGTCYQVPLSQAAFYIPNYKDTIAYNNNDFIVREVKRDFNTNNVIITAYKA